MRLRGEEEEEIRRRRQGRQEVQARPSSRGQYCPAKKDRKALGRFTFYPPLRSLRSSEELCAHSRFRRSPHSLLYCWRACAPREATLS